MCLCRFAFPFAHTLSNWTYVIWFCLFIFSHFVYTLGNWTCTVWLCPSVFNGHLGACQHIAGFGFGLHFLVIQLGAHKHIAEFSFFILLLAPQLGTCKHITGFDFVFPLLTIQLSACEHVPGVDFVLPFLAIQLGVYKHVARFNFILPLLVVQLGSYNQVAKFGFVHPLLVVQLGACEHVVEFNFILPLLAIQLDACKHVAGFVLALRSFDQVCGGSFGSHNVQRLSAPVTLCFPSSIALHAEVGIACPVHTVPTFSPFWPATHGIDHPYLSNGICFKRYVSHLHLRLFVRFSSTVPIIDAWPTMFFSASFLQVNDERTYNKVCSNSFSRHTFLKLK